MAQLKMRKFMRNNAGFTLIEVLVALAILSIALTAIIKATSQNIKDTLYLQEKTIATWVGTQVVNEIRLKLLTVPTAPDTLEQDTLMLNQKWPWQASLHPTPNSRIFEINVDVYNPANTVRLIHLMGYAYAQ